HVLPTGGTARWASGLSANDFLRRTSLIWVDRRGLERLAPDVRLLADKEGLTAPRLSVDIRLDDPPPPARGPPRRPQLPPPWSIPARPESAERPWPGRSRWEWWPSWSPAWRSRAGGSAATT